MTPNDAIRPGQRWVFAWRRQRPFYVARNVELSDGRTIAVLSVDYPTGRRSPLHFVDHAELRRDYRLVEDAPDA